MAKKLQKEVKATPRQWTYASDFVRNQSMLKAFEVAYPKHANKPMHRKRAMAKRIFAQQGTKMAIQELTQDVRRAEKLTVEGHLAELKRIRDAAFKAKQFATARQAEVDRGKCAGFYVERSMNLSVTTSPDQIRSQMEALLEQHPQMAKLLGVEPPRVLISHQACSPSETSEETDSPVIDVDPEPTD